MTAGPEELVGLRVVMLVQNAFEHDTRVEKQAEALAEAGCIVFVVALRLRGLPMMETRDGYRVLRVDPQGRWWAGVAWRLSMLHRRSITLVARVLGIARPSAPAPVSVGSRPGSSIASRIPAGLRSRSSAGGGRGRARLRRRRRRRPVAASGGGDARHRSSLMVTIWSGLVRLGRRLPRVLRTPLAQAAGRVRGLIRRLMRLRMSGSTATTWLRRNRLAKGILPPGIRSLARLVPMTRYAIAVGPDLVVAHDANTLASAVCLQRLLGVPFIYDSHELFLERNLPSSAEGAERWLWKPIEADGVARSAHRYSVSRPVCDRLSKMYGCSFDALPNAQAAGHATSGSGELRSTIAADSAGVAIYLGRVTRGRGLETMVEAADIRSDIHWVIMGPASDGPYGASLSSEAKDRGLANLHVLPPVSRSEVGGWLAEATVAVVPSDSPSASYELGVGNKSFHALAAGVPQVMTDQPGKRAFAEETGAAILYPPGDAERLAECVGRLVDSPSEREALSRSALVAARRYDWDLLKVGYVETCGRIVANSRGRS